MDANFTPASTAAPYAGRCPENSLTCARILSPAEVLVIAVDIPVLLFHASVFYFILRQITGNKKDFRSAFYRLYAAMSVVDMIHTLDVYICLRLPVYGLFLDFWESSVVVASAGYLISGYCVYYQFFSHLTIALNRFSVFAFPQSYKRVWTKKNVHWAIVVNSLLPFPFLSFRFPASVRYLYVGANSMGVRYVDPDIRKYAAMTSASLSLSTSIASAFFELLAIVAYRRYAKAYTSTNEQRHDLRLLICSLLMLIAQWLYTAYQCTLVVSSLTSNLHLLGIAQQQVAWVIDILCLSGSFCLFLTRLLLA
ncbi:hypothetical protein AAVH_11846 [Aphelenchoides avenae]|nr:hypothetical protein AAVH_11846 [Aphelenchus avenae]